MAPLWRSFLDDIDRIASRSYTPSDADVVRARLRTIGIQEHSLVFEDGVKVSFSCSPLPVAPHFQFFPSFSFTEAYGHTNTDDVPEYDTDDAPVWIL